MAKTLFPNKIIWLASYPKSGNTWFRAFLTALLNDGEIEINDMKTDGIFSSREIFEAITDIDSRDLYDTEVKLMLPDVYRQLAGRHKTSLLMKVHDAFSYNSDNNPIIPEDVTHCAVYIMRNPLDIVGSLANHNNSTIDDAIKLLNNPNGTLASQKNNLNINGQLRQLMYDWGGHVTSWTSLPSFPVHIVRYEDMLQDTFNTFDKVLKLIGWEYTPDQIQTAIEATRFSKMSGQESEKGFSEKNAKSPKFFRLGKTGGWQNELNADQIQSVISCHENIMKQYQY